MCVCVCALTLPLVQPVFLELELGVYHWRKEAWIRGKVPVRKAFCSWICKRRIFPLGMKQSMCCRSHVAAVAEIKLLNAEVLGTHAFLLSQSQINAFIPHNLYTKDSFKCITCAVWLYKLSVVSAQESCAVSLHRNYFYGRIRIWQSCIGIILCTTCSTLSHITYRAEIEISGTKVGVWGIVGEIQSRNFSWAF